MANKEMKTLAFGDVTYEIVDEKAREDLQQKISNTDKGRANGIASLDNNGKVPSNQLPEIKSYDVGGEELGVVKNGGNVVINPDGTMTAPENKIDIPIEKGEGENSLEQTLNREVFTVANEKINESEDVDKIIDEDGNIKIKSGAIGAYSSIFGGSAQAKGKRSQASGSNTVALGGYSHAEGNETFAKGYNSHSEGLLTSALGDNSHAEGAMTSAIGVQSHAEGISTQANGENSHAEGGETTAIGNNSHAEGAHTIAEGAYSHSEGARSIAKGYASHAEGHGTVAEGYNSHTEGYGTVAEGYNSHTEGYQTSARGNYQHVQGKWNKVPDEADKNKYAHIVGGGASINERKNIHTLDWYGNAWYQGSVTSTGADYAEFFEWLDGNPNKEDRVGLLVTLDGEKIRLANNGDEILGIISGTAAVLGDNYECDWNGKYLTDDFGRVIYDLVEEFIDVEHIEFKEVEKEIIDEETNETRIEIELEEVKTTEKKSLGFWKQPRLNPDYNSEQKYINRSDRPEWDTVGMLGKLFVRDDGTAVVNEYVTVGENGIATASSDKTNMRVLSRVNENVVRVLLK